MLTTADSIPYSPSPNNNILNNWTDKSCRLNGLNESCVSLLRTVNTWYVESKRTDRAGSIEQTDGLCRMEIQVHTTVVSTTQSSARHPAHCGWKWVHDQQRGSNPGPLNGKSQATPLSRQVLLPIGGSKTYPLGHVHFSAVATYHFSMLGDPKIWSDRELNPKAAIQPLQSKSVKPRCVNYSWQIERVQR